MAEVLRYAHNPWEGWTVFLSDGMVGNKAARREIAMIKIVAPSVACTVIDGAMQLFGGGGTANDHFLGVAYATARLLRLADGPDEVHRNQLARLELKRVAGLDSALTGGEAAPLTRQQAFAAARAAAGQTPPRS